MKERKDGESDLSKMDMNTNPIWNVLDGGEFPKKKKPVKKKVKKRKKSQMDREVDSLFSELSKSKKIKSKKRKKTQKNLKQFSFSWFHGLILLLITVIIGFLLLIVIKYEQVTVKSDSMDSTIKSGEHILYQEGYPIKRFNIVLVEQEGQLDFLRVIGMPGDKVRMKDDVLYINDSMYDEIYLKNNYVEFKYNKEKANYTTDFEMEQMSDSHQESVPMNQYLLLGDNRQDCIDSRIQGFYDESQIKGIVLMKIWPFSEIGPIE